MSRPFVAFSLVLLLTASAAATDVPISGNRARFVDLPKQRRAQVVSYGTLIDIATLDPTATGATLDIFSPTTRQALSVDLPASQWSGSVGARRFRFRTSGNPTTKVLLVDRRMLRVSLLGSLGYALGQPQGSVVLSLQIGATKFCTVFGGTIANDDGTRFVARMALLPATCPTLVPVCGNGVPEAGEECDDGNSVDDDACRNDCTGAVQPPVCTPLSTAPCYGGPPGTNGVGTCASGTQTCNGDGTSYEACIGDIMPVAEVCGDGLDNDCDGVGDDGCVCTPLSTVPCYGGPPGTNGVGTCAGGTQTCNSDGTSYEACMGDVTPVAEVCGDGLDNDCSGVADDGCVCASGSTASCYSGPGGTAGVGTCSAGTRQCNTTGTGYGACVGDVTPIAEVCGDALDNDCDGTPDDGCVCTPGSTASCYTGPAGTVGVGLCVAGTQTCNSGGTGYANCIGEITPVPDECGDGLDNDCDGTVECTGGFCNGGNCTNLGCFWQASPDAVAWEVLDNGVNPPNGQDTIFYRSGLTYREVLDRPSNNEAYFLCAYQFIAVQLNKANGADTTDVDDSFDTARQIFETYSPGDVADDALLDQRLRGLAVDLRAFNTGEIGPGSCDACTCEDGPDHNG